MYFGELKTHSEQYQNGHSTGSVRAYDDAISFFEALARSQKQDGHDYTYTPEEIIEKLKQLKFGWIRHCDTFGMGEYDVKF